jgi:hypothetical protein
MISAAALIACLLPSLPAAPAADTVVVCPQAFRQALAPWIEYRSAAGHTISVISSSLTAEQARSQIRRIAADGALRFIVLVGDADPAMDASGRLRAVSTPTQHVPAKVNIHWGPERDIPSDNWFADLDDDRLPDVAVGRITADSPQDLSTIVEKILRYEQSNDFGLWRRRLNFVAGLGGFGPIADFVLEASAKRLITDGIPAAYQTTMTQASWRSPYCPDPRLFQETTLNRLSEGCLFWVYIGHGHTRNVDWMRVPGGAFPILTDRDLPRVRCENGCSPIACFLACYTAAFDQPQDCLAEEMLRTPGCPVAIIGGSRVTMPYAMACLGTELLDQCFSRRASTLGEAMLAAKRGMMNPKPDSANRLVLDALAKALSPAPADLAAERSEHLDLFTLIGDPLLTIRQPEPVQLAVRGNDAKQRQLTVAIQSPIAGKCTVELVSPRDQLRFTAPRRATFELTGESFEQYTRTYRAANDDRWTSSEATVDGDAITSVSLIVPSEARGAAHLRAYVQGESSFASGAIDVDLSELKAKAEEKRVSSRPTSLK